LIKRRGDKHPEVIPESLDFIDEESLRMQNLIENLLHLSRADRAKIKLTSQNLSILVQNIGQHYQASIKQLLIYDIEDDLFVLGNEDMLQQILIALLDNACKYSPVDQPITLSLHKDNNNIELSVKDQGIGIEDDQKKKVFQRFYRVDQSHSTKIKGSGLGLAIVKQLVNLNHANISIEDNQPHGTIFMITFKNSK
jgi:Signal transduction histidine kinase